MESFAAALRSDLRLRGYPCLTGAWALVNCYPQISVVELAGEPGSCLHHPSGRKTLCVPPGDPYVLTEETGHALFSNGLSDYLAPWLPSPAKVERWRAEHVAQAFARIFLLPPELLFGSDWEIAEESGCPVAAVRVRLQEVAQDRRVPITSSLFPLPTSEETRRWFEAADELVNR